MSGGKDTVMAVVERMAPEGESIARVKGSSRVIFVPYGAPGDEVEVEVLSAKSTYARARILRLIAPGPERVNPRCRLHFQPGGASFFCGGCDWQHLAYSAQLAHKKKLVEDCLKRIGKIQDARVLPVLSSPLEWGYRNKVQIPFGQSPEQGVIAGFYAPQSHRIVDFSACPVQPELTVRLALKAKDIARRRKWPVYDEKSGRGWLRHFFARSNAKGEVLAALVTRTPGFPDREDFVKEMRDAFPELCSVYQNVQTEKTSVILGPGWIRLWGARRMDERLGKFSFAVSPGAFLQVNTPAAEILYDVAREFLRRPDRSWDWLLDLYCGVGTLAAWLSDTAQKIVGIEENRDAIKDAWDNAERNGIKNARFVSGRVESALPAALSRISGRVAAVLDPPRQGLMPAAAAALGRAAFLERIVYVSCNPATFARDAGIFINLGWRLAKVQPVDLFPQTSHVEMVGLFERAG
ncbi:MAG: 23S rRNA (uracil(1939)-C(5))-methyltransferase RlmD [Elusimicrobiota bacterium]